MKHKAANDAPDVPGDYRLRRLSFHFASTSSVQQRGFRFAGALLLAAAGCAALALALVAPGVTSSAHAQTMGEYGGVTAQSAGAASSMPKVGAPSLGARTNSAPGNYFGSQHTEEIRTYDPPANDRSRDDQDTDQRDDSPKDWEQVK